jgi:hypothetical protein
LSGVSSIQEEIVINQPVNIVPLSEEIAANATFEAHLRWADDARRLEEKIELSFAEIVKILVERDALRESCTRLREVLEDTLAYLGQVRAADFKDVRSVGSRRTEAAFKLVNDFLAAERNAADANAGTP